MNEYEIYLLILGMAAATYLPRVLPAFLTDSLMFGRWMKKFLTVLPYAAMSALVFPGIFYVEAENSIFGVVGGLTAILLAFAKCPLIVCVLGAVGSNCILYLLV